MNYGRRYGETWRRGEGMPWIGGRGTGWRRTETLIPSYIYGGNGAALLRPKRLRFRLRTRRTEINRVPFVLLTIVACNDQVDATHR